MSRFTDYRYLPVLIVTALMALIFPFLDLPALIALTLVIVIYIGIFALINPKIGLLLLIVVRPILDIFTGESILQIGGLNVNLSYILGALTILFVVIVALSNFKKIKRAPTLIPWLLFLSAAFLSIFVSVNFRSSATEWIRLISIFSLFIASYALTETKEDLDNLIRAIIVSTFVPVLLAFTQFMTNTGMTVPLEGISNRIFGTFAHPNLFAYYLIMPIALAAVLFMIRQIGDFIYMMFLPFLAIALVLTFTRGAWAALVIALFFVGIIRFRKLLIGGIMLLLIIYVIVPPVKNRVNALLTYQDPYGSIQWRIDLWSDSVGYIQDKMILGYGTGAAEEVILAKRGEEFGSPSPHNDYLKIVLENGYLGLIFYGFLIFSILSYLLEEYRFAKTEKRKTYALFLLGLALAFYIMSFADNILRNTALQWSFWALVGAFLATSKIAENQNNKVKTDLPAAIE